MLEAAFAFTVICMALPGVWSNNWAVSLPMTEVCAWAGTVVTLACQYDFPGGYRVRSVMWYRLAADDKREYPFHTDSSIISPSYKGRVKYSGSYKTCWLQISNLRGTDSGLYYFRFETDQQQGKWTSTDAVNLSVTELQVQVHPARLDNLFALGETVYLGCVARGCAAAGKTFILFRSTLSLGKTPRIPIYNFDHQHAGTYTCRPATLPNVQSPAVTLAVGHAPRLTTILVSPRGQIMEGSSVTMTCSSEATPAVESYAWFKDRGPWSAPDSFKSQLHLWKAGPSDQGDYSCVAQNSLGRQESRPVRLTITYAPRSTSVLISPPGDVLEGSPVTLTCSSNANPPVRSYSWFKLIGAQPWERGSTQNITFPSVRAHHGGQYYCKVWNQHGHDTSTTASLVVLYAPKNTSASARPSREIEAGSSVTLTCNSHANPAVENYTWFRIDTADAWETRSGQSYTITAVSPRESGQYYCQARNRLGAHSSPVLTIRVRGRLRVVALASAVGVSAVLITLTVLIMVSKNMHIVEADTTEENQQGSLMEEDTLFQDGTNETYKLRVAKMAQIPEETEAVYENVHPSIVPMNEVPQSSEEESLNYITVHCSRNRSQDKFPVANSLPEKETEHQGGPQVIYTALARSNHVTR